MSSASDPFSFPLVQDVVCPPYRVTRSDAGPAERLKLIAGRQQEKLESARILLVGAGGHGLAAWGLLRSGATSICICDPDFFDMTNLSRQLGYASDRGRPKAHRVAANLRREAIRGAQIRSIALPFPQALEHVAEEPTVVSCLVDDNACRVEVSRYAREMGIPAVISGLSHDGVRLYSFLQDAEGPCIACVFPDITDVRAPCVAACAKTVLSAAGQIVHFVEMALMGWPQDSEPYNYRELDLNGRVESRRLESRRTACWLCGVS